MPTNLIGRFYFKQTSNGNLIGEFSNNLSVKASTESSDLIPINPANPPFIGFYHSTWQEDGKTASFAVLTISQKTASGGLFRLIWTNNNVVIFRGEGMLCDNILTGDYLDEQTSIKLGVYRFPNSGTGNE